MRRVRGGDPDAAGEAGLRLPGLRPRLPQAVPRPRRTALRRDLAAKHGTVSMNNVPPPCRPPKGCVNPDAKFTQPIGPEIKEPS